MTAYAGAPCVLTARRPERNGTEHELTAKTSRTEGQRYLLVTKVTLAVYPPAVIRHPSTFPLLTTKGVTRAVETRRQTATSL